MNAGHARVGFQRAQQLAAEDGARGAGDGDGEFQASSSWLLATSFLTPALKTIKPIYDSSLAGSGSLNKLLYLKSYSSRTSYRGVMAVHTCLSRLSISKSSNL